MTEGRLIAAGDLLQSKVFGVASITEKSVSRTAGEELDGAEPARRIQRFGVGR